MPRDESTLDTKILVYGPGDSITFEDLGDSEGELDPHPKDKDVTSLESEEDPNGNCPLRSCVQDAIEGRWVGTFADDRMPPFECIVGPIVNGELVAKGRDYSLSLKILGHFDEQSAHVSFTLSRSGYFPLKFKGSYNQSRDTIHGWWAMITEYPHGEAEQENPPRIPDRTLSMTRHSVNSFRFKNLLDPGNEVPELSMARRRWAFAIQTVRFGVQDKLGSWDFMRRRLIERNNWIELTIRQFPPDGVDITRGLVNDQQLARWEEMKKTIHPSTLAIYFSIAQFLQDRRLYDM